MKTKKVIELSIDDLKIILCKHFELQEIKSQLIINVKKGQFLAPDTFEIKIEEEIDNEN